MSLGLRRKRRPGNRAQTKSESAHVDAVKRAGCLCCLALGYAHDEDGPMVEAHHLLEGGIRRGHLFVVGLCAYHHRNRLIVAGHDHAWHREHLGPSLEAASGPFHERWGDDESLLAAQNELLLGEKAA